MRLGVVILPEQRWSDAGDVWRRAEELGFDHAWTYDHLAWRSLRDSPWFGAVPVLTAAALVTEHIRLGPLVASPNFRHPVPFAKEVMTLDDISGGRLTLGIGAGGPGWDATMLGHEAWSLNERASRFSEFVELLDRVLREPASSSRGEWYSADEARSIPGCVQQPRVPFAVAATGPRGMRLAATHGDTWVTAGDPNTETAGVDEAARVIGAQSAQLEQACAVVGRDPQTINRLVLTGPLLNEPCGSADELRDAIGRYEEVGVTDLVVHWPRSEPPYEGDPAIFERVISEVAS